MMFNYVKKSVTPILAITVLLSLSGCGSLSDLLQNDADTTKDTTAASLEKIYVSEQGSNVISVYSASDYSLVKEIDLNAADRYAYEGKVPLAKPNDLLILGDRAYVALNNQNSSYENAGPGVVAVIDTKTDAVVDTIPLTGENANKLCYSAFYPDYLFVLMTGSYQNGIYQQDAQLAAIHLPTNKVVASIPIQESPSQLIISASGELIVSCLPKLLKYTFASPHFTETQTYTIAGAGTYSLDMQLYHGQLLITDYHQDTLYLVDTALTETTALNTSDMPGVIGIYNDEAFIIGQPYTPNSQGVMDKLDKTQKITKGVTSFGGMPNSLKVHGQKAFIAQSGSHSFLVYDFVTGKKHDFSTGVGSTPKDIGLIVSQ